MWLISKVLIQKCNSPGNLQRSKLVWAVFENFALSESLEDLQTLDKFSYTSRSIRLQIMSWKFRNIQRKTPVLESFFNNVSGPQVCNFINKKLQHRCFPVNIAKFLRTTFFIEHLWWLLLYFGELPC